MPLTEKQRYVLQTLGKLEKPASIGQLISRNASGATLGKLVRLGHVEKKSVDEIVYFMLTEKGRRFVNKSAKQVVLGGKYRLETSLGSGSYGKVWKAKDVSLKRHVAVKLLHGGVKDFEQLKTEGQALSELSHKNIVTVHDLGSDEKNGWLVTEFIDGPSLEDHLAGLTTEGKWCSLKDGCDIVEQTLEALEAAHDKGRVHGDIKPANILKPPTGEIKLSDFGVAKILNSSSPKQGRYPAEHKRRLGSPSYVAPEILNNEPRDFQTDLFSVGLLAYVLLTGKHPFLHPSGIAAIPDLIKSETYQPPRPKELNDEISEKHDRIIMRLLEKDKEKRYRNAREALDEWRETKTTMCPRCDSENPFPNKFCGNCGENLKAPRDSEWQRKTNAVLSEPERDLATSYALFSANRTQEAIVFVQRILERNPDFVKGWTHLAYMLNSERHYEEAEDACSKGIELDPDASNAYQTRGFARSNLGKFNEAIEDFSRAFSMEDDDRRKSQILYQRAYAKRLAGRFEDAFNDSDEAVRLDRTNSKARSLRVSLMKFIS